MEIHRGRRCSAIWAVCGMAVVFGAGMVAESDAALPKFDTLVPAAAKVFVSCRNLREFDAALQRSKFGGIFNDPNLKPFFDHVKQHIDERLAESQQVLGLGLNDFENLSDHEAAFTVVDLGPDQAGQAQTGTAVLVDISGHEAQLPAVRQKIAAELTKRQAAAAQFAAQSGANGTRYDIPPRTPDRPAIIMIEAVQQTPAGTLWIIADGPLMAETVSTALAGGQSPSLAQNADYQKIVAATSPAPGEPPSHLSAFVDPMGLLAALRAYEFPPKKLKPDPLQVFTDAGFTAVKGIGGQATFGAGEYGLFLRVFALAPPPYEKSMQMLTFPVGAEYAPQEWVAADAVAYATAYWDAIKAFDNFDPVFDGFLDDPGIWKDVLRSLKEDIDGPQIDIRDEFVALLGQRVTGVVDHQLPPRPDSSRAFVAIEIKHVTAEEVKQRTPAGAAPPSDEEAQKQADLESASIDARVTAALEKTFKGDPGAKLVPLQINPNEPPLSVWQVTQTQKVPPGAANQEGVVNGQRVVLQFYVTAHLGHVFLASGTEILQKTFAPQTTPRLAVAPDYVALTDKLGGFVGQEASAPVALGFTRLDQLVRIDYELFRAGKLSGSETLAGQLLDLSLRLAEKEGRQWKPLDGTKLPPFELVQKYFSPAGAIFSNRADGLFALGFTLESLTPVPEAAGNGAAPANNAPPANGAATPPAQGASRPTAASR